MKSTKHTNETIDKIIKDRPLIRVDDYIGIKHKINFKCLLCSNVWKVTPDSVINIKTNCPLCFGNTKLTNDELDRRLCKDIIRIDNIINCNKKIKFKCLKCDSLFSASPLRAIAKKNCAQCSNKEPLTNLIIDERLKSRNIQRVSDYIVGQKIEFKCLICFNNWKSSSNKVLNRNRGCHHCNMAPRYNNDLVDTALEKLNIKRIGDVIGDRVKISFKCEICNNIWNTRPRLVVNGHGCPECSIRKNEKLLKSLLESNYIEFKHNFLIKKIDNTIVKNLNVDFYIPNKNIILEYNGAQHYGPIKFGGINIERAKINFIKQQDRDKYVEAFCNSNKIKLICIDGRKYQDKKLERYIKDELIPILKDNV